MFKIIFQQANWGILGSIFGFSVGFFVKIYLLDIVGLEAWGKYVTAQTFVGAVDVLLAIGIPFTLIKFIPSLLPEDKNKAERMASAAVKYGLIVGLLFLVVIYFIAPLLDSFIYSEIDGLTWILFFMSIHVPISLLFGVITSLYRSILKIKELIIYGTLISVSIRAITTFIVFHFTNDIIYFILIELVTQLFVLIFLISLFHNNEFSLLRKSIFSEFSKDKTIYNYTTNIFFNTLIAFIAGKSLNIILTLMLPASDIGAYNILITITGLSTFLLVNLNKVFAPAISKLYKEKQFEKLNDLYEKTTFSINLFTIPLIILITFFSDEILSLYSHELVMYKSYLIFMLIGGGISIASGSSGTLMLMAGLEKQNLILQLVKAVLVIGFAIWLIPLYGLLVVVTLYVSFMFFLNFMQLFYIKKYLGISPFSKSLGLLFLMSIPIIIFSAQQEYIFEIYHYVIITFFVFLLYFLSFFPSIYTIFKIIKE